MAIYFLCLFASWSKMSELENTAYFWIKVFVEGLCLDFIHTPTHKC